MALTIYWTDFAIEQLETIFDFYNTEVNLYLISIIQK